MASGPFLAKGQHKRALALAALMAAYFLSVFHRLAIGIMADRLMLDLNLGAVEIGLLTAIFFYPYAAMQFPAGILADTLGIRRLVTALLLLAALASISFSFVHSFWPAFFIRLLIGLSVSIVFVPTQKFITTFFPPSYFTNLSSALVGAGMVGALSAAAPLAFFVSRIGWRAVFLGLGLLTGILAVAVWKLVPEASSLKDTPSKNHESAIPLRTLKPYALGSAFGHSIQDVLQEPGIWPLAWRNFLNYGAMMTFQSLWAGPYLILILGMDRVHAGSLLMLLSIGQLLSSPFAGIVSENLLHSRKIPAVVSGCLNIFFWIPFAFWTDSLSPFQIGLLFLFYGLVAGLSTSPGLAQLKELYSPTAVGAAFGFGNLFTMAGAAALPIFVSTIMSYRAPVGSVMQINVFETGFRLLLGISLVSALIISFSKETLPPRHGLNHKNTNNPCAR